MDTLSYQVSAFLITILSGFVFGVLYDLYRVLRGTVRPRHYLATVMDILFWVVVTPVMIIQFVFANWIDLRFYVVLGVTLGLFLYFAVFSSLLLSALFGLGAIASQIAALVVHGVGTVLMVPVNLVRGFGLRIRWGKPRVTSQVKVRPGVRWRGGILDRIFRFHGR